MLVLSRKLGEAIIIEGSDGRDDIVVRVLRVSENSVRLGIDAPRDQAILREEMLEFDLELSETETAQGERDTESLCK